MSDALRYRLIDEPQPSILGRFALPPLLVFIVAQLLLPWGSLLIAANAAALNGPHRNREIGFAVVPVGIWFAALQGLDAAVRADILAVNQAGYLFVTAVGIGLLFIAAAFVSQERTAEIRTYLRQQG